jgi:hypothetical protein
MLINQLSFGLGILPPEQEHKAFFVLRQALNGAAGKFLPPNATVGTGLACSHR